MSEVGAMSKPSSSIRRTAGLGTLVSALLGVTLPCAPAMSADEPDVLNDSFFIALGTYLVDAAGHVDLHEMSDRSEEAARADLRQA